MSYSNREGGCLIWPGHEGRATYDGRTDVFYVDSPRAAGSYEITVEAKLLLTDGDFSNRDRALLTTILVDNREQGDRWPIVTTDLLGKARSKSPTPVDQRGERLLQFISNQSDSLADAVEVKEESYGAYAWSESVEWGEVTYLLDYLEEMGWIQGQRSVARSFTGGLTVAGHGRLAEQRVNVDSSQVFVAMWFDDSMSEAFENGIEPAILEAGYVPLRIDQKEHVNKIDDEIISELRRSRFLVSDFTQGEDGARGGVYYEAGFAHGLDLPVIFTCRDDTVETLHFDTEHYNHIVWTTSMELREKLKNRILAVIGEGPEAHRSP